MKFRGVERIHIHSKHVDAGHVWRGTNDHEKNAIAKERH
jgi:hypothetical protein